MARLPIEKARVSRFAGRSVARYIDLVHRTSRIVSEPADVEAFLARHAPAIVAVWHGQFLMAPQAKPLHVPLAIMLARHGDAELFATALARFNTTLIRGAGAAGRRKDRGGTYALRAAIRTLESGVWVGMTADVPPGPARQAGLGIVMLARVSGRPIIPLAAATSRYHAFNTWSRMTLNLPYGKLACVFGEPIHVPADADAAQLEAARLAVEAGLNRATAKAYQMAGADPARATPKGTAVATEPAGSSGIDPTASGQAAGSGLGLGLKTYRLATRLMQPAVPLLLGARERQGKEEAARRGERLGVASRPRPSGQLIWIHAASVGELNAVLPLADGLRAVRPGVHCLITTGTVTSAKVAEARLGRDDVHQYVPLDAPRFVTRFLDHWRPDGVILTESEIWPNIIIQCAARGLPLALVNGRMSSRSFKRWRQLSGVSEPLFSRFDLVLAQNEDLAQRFREVGVRQVLSVGNLKNDAPPPPVDDAALTRLRQALAGRPFYLAASTHDGEERLLATAHRMIARRHEALCTVIVPRHPERGSEIGEAMKAQGLRIAQRSLGELPTDTTDVYIADTLGELGTLYALSPIAFIGGSLIERGGHNPIEAIQHGAVVVSGRHWFNFSDTYEALRRHDAVIVVADADELATKVGTLIGDERELTRSKAAAQAALATMSGALARSVAEIIKLVPDAKELLRAG